MDKGRQKRLADITEKLGVGIFIGGFVQGLFSTRSDGELLLLTIIAFLIGFILMLYSILLSKEG